MIRLSRMGIRNLAASDTVYSRGLQDYKQNHVVNATWSNTKQQYRITVKDNFEYMVSIQVFEDGSFEHKCNCSEHLKEEGACKHVITALFFILNYVERTLMEEPDNPAEKTVYQILGYFSNQEDSLTQGETYHIKVGISIPSILRSDTGSAIISLRVGNHHYYKIQSIKKFLTDFYNKENIMLGKEFKFIHGESKFDKQSKKILDYILQIYEIQDAIDKLFYTKLFSKANIILTKNMLLRLLDILDEGTFHLELYGKEYENVLYAADNPKIEYDLSIIDDGIIMDYHGKYSVVPITEAGELLYYNGCIYRPTKRFLGNYLPFYNNLGGKKEPLIFKGINKNKFLEVVLPKISETMELTVPQEIQDRFITTELKPVVYLDKIKNYIHAELKYRYGDHEFNAFENAPSDNFIIIRQPQKEDYYIDYLEKLGFQPKQHSFIMRNEDDIYEFLIVKIHDLAQDCELYYSEAFKKINIKSPGSFKAGLRVSNRLDLLEMDLNYEEVPSDELKDLFKSYRLKKKYYRLKNGSFINLEEDNIKEVWGILNYLGISGKELNNETIGLSKNTALYLNTVFQEKNLEVEKNEDFSQLVEKILNPSTTEYELPDGIQADLRGYQVTGYKWLRTLADNNLGGILADDMGLGKTLQTIVFIAAIKEKQDSARFLIVCPSSLIYNWQDELENFAPHLTSNVVTGTPKERQELIEEDSKVDILITSYPLMRRDITLYQKYRFHSVFIDEAQYIKNADSLNAKSVKLLDSDHRYALTGTPIENSLSELWSIFDFIMPDYLFSHTKFVNQYEKPIMRSEEGVLEDLNRRILPFILRRMKKDVLQELPDKVETKMLTDMVEEQKKVYLSYVENAKTELDNEIKENGLEKSKLKILAVLTRLRQICCHPATFIENYTGGSGKLELLMEIITDAIANDHRILVFSQFTSMLSIIEKELKKQNIQNFYLEGSTKLQDRNEYVKRFNQGEGKVFLISLKAGGTGLNLIGADTVIHFDPWWNPAVEEQATDRAYRIGQVNSVHVIKLITKGTIEEKIYKLQIKKKNLSDSVIQSQEVFINSMTKEELEDIFG
ncbi:MAG: DEAD/DEAH box helicase [Anaerocolumna sp.]